MRSNGARAAQDLDAALPQARRFRGSAPPASRAGCRQGRVTLDAGAISSAAWRQPWSSSVTTTADAPAGRLLEPREPQCRRRQHHPGPVVVAEQHRALVAARGDDDLRRPNADEPIAARALRHADQPALVDADGGGVGEVLDPRLGRDQLASRAAASRPRRPAIRSSPASIGRIRVRRWPPSAGWSSMSTTCAPAAAASSAARQPAGPPPITATSREHVALARVDPGVRVRPGLDLADPGDRAENLLVQRPEGARPDERLVVEADRQEAIEPVGDRHQVEPDRGPRVLAPDVHPLVQRRHACPHVRDPVDVHHAVRAAPGTAQQRRAAGGT